MRGPSSMALISLSHGEVNEQYSNCVSEWKSGEEAVWSAKSRLSKAGILCYSTSICSFFIMVLSFWVRVCANVVSFRFASPRLFATNTFSR